MSGFITMHRDAFDHPLLRDGDRFRAWFWMVAKACWKQTPFDIGGRIVTLQRGQFCCSVRELADTWGWSKSAVDRFLTRLKTERMIGTDAGTGRLVITILNYSKYQDVYEDAGTPTAMESAEKAAQRYPNATRSTPDQKPGQQRDTLNAGINGVNLGSGNGDRDSSGTAAGQQRDIKEQGNKGTIVDEEANASPSTSREPVFEADLFGDDVFPVPAKPSGRQRQPKVAMSLDWQPAPLPPDVADLVAQWPPGRLDRETADFVEYWFEDGSKRPGWDRTFRSRIRVIHDRVMREYRDEQRQHRSPVAGNSRGSSIVEIGQRVASRLAGAGGSG